MLEIKIFLLLIYAATSNTRIKNIQRAIYGINYLQEYLKYENTFISTSRNNIPSCSRFKVSMTFKFLFMAPL